MPGAVSSVRSASGEFLPSIALMRALAALLVVYDHLVGMWLQRNRVAWWPASFLDRWVFDPFHLMGHAGGLAVAVFFLVSGFVIFHVARRESARTFALRRALRIYPPLWVSTVLLLAAFSIAIALGAPSSLDDYAVSEVLRSDDRIVETLLAMTLANYLVGTPSVNGVAWTLVIEVLFYAAVLLLLPLVRERPRVAILFAFAGLAALQVVAKSNAVVFLVAVNGVYVCFLFLGSLMYLRWAGRIGNAFFLAGSVAFAALFLHGVKAYVAQPPLALEDYAVSYGYAWLIFAAILLLDRHIRLGRVIHFFSRISYSLYLNHGGLGILAITLLFPILGYAASLAVTLALVVSVSALSYHWVELPSQRWARRLTAGT